MPSMPKKVSELVPFLLNRMPDHRAIQQLQFNIEEAKTARVNAGSSLSTHINAETTSRGDAINAVFNDISGLVGEVRSAR
jgi:hypothetical protein